MKIFMDLWMTPHFSAWQERERESSVRTGCGVRRLPREKIKRLTRETRLSFQCHAKLIHLPLSCACWVPVFHFFFFFFWLSGRWKNFTLDKVWCIFWKHWTGGELVSSVALWVGENGFLEKCFVFFWDKFGRGFRRGQRLSASWWTLLTSGDGKIQKLSYLLKNDIYIYLFPLSTVEVFQATQNSPSSTILFLMRL